MTSYKKDFFKDKIEPFIYKKIENKKYETNIIDSIDLLTWNRFDLAFKLFYLDMKEKNIALALQVYREDIRCQTSEKFKEYGNKHKNTFDSYVKIFDQLYENIKRNGFDDNQTIIPLSKTNSIENGAHRVAASIQLHQKITCARFNLPITICDYNFYHHRNVSSDMLNIIATKFIEYAKNTYIAFLWPSGKDKLAQSEKCFSNIVYKTKIDLNSQGAFYLLYELYNHMDWIGSSQNNFAGIQQKLVECFPEFSAVTVIVFQSNNLKEVRKTKEKVRKIHNIGFSSIHITDTKEEAIKISRLIFNKNGLHFLNYANSKKYNTLLNNKLEEYKKYIDKNNLNLNDMVLDSGMIMTLYGLRECNDIDYFIDNNDKIQWSDNDIECHDNELEFHAETKRDLIYNQEFYFYYNNFKFISYNQLYKMKKNRGNKKDINDIKMMDAFMENNSIKKLKVTVIQYILYAKVKFRQKIISLLKYTGLYEISKNYYDKKIRKY